MGRPQWLASAVALICAVHVARANFEVEQGAVKVLFPPNNGERFSMALADFGRPKYGGSLIGELYYNNSTACEGVACNYACNFTDPTGDMVVRIPKEPGKSYVMLIDRGPNIPTLICYFLQKVYNAQLAGADAVLIANDVDGDLSTLVLPDDEDAQSILPLVTVSAALISKRDGDMLKSLLQDNPTGVTLALNWTDVLPRRPQVSWELWTNTDDNCGPVCDAQLAFLKNLSSTATRLQQSNVTLFTPHYMLWSCPAAFANTTECRSQCLAGGRYCVPDPDDDMTGGYTGTDVLIMNIHQLCVFHVSSASGQPWLWWDYAMRFADICHMDSGNFTQQCAREIFSEIGGPSLSLGRGSEMWEQCIGDISSYGADTPIPILEQELVAQVGGNGTSAVTILPTIRINGQQYRGSLDTPSVLRAICSAFPLNQEPDVCVAEVVSEDECKPGRAGALECSSPEHQVTGTTKCTNTFNGYSCACQDGYIAAQLNGVQQCMDINECTMTNVAQFDDNCSCTRCACINQQGGYSCTGPLTDYCTPEHNYGGCWHQQVGTRLYSACVDTLPEYRANAARGDSSSQWFTCSCPPCFRPDSKGGCEAACDLRLCEAQNGTCGQAATQSAAEGISVWLLVIIVVSSVVFSVLLMVAVFQFVLRKYVRKDMNNVMNQYVPLEAVGEENQSASNSAATHP